MTTRRSTRTSRRGGPVRRAATPYMLVSQAADGRIRTERFKNAAEYRRRIAALSSSERAVSLHQLINLLGV